LKDFKTLIVGKNEKNKGKIKRRNCSISFYLSHSFLWVWLPKIFSSSLLAFLPFVFW